MQLEIRRLWPPQNSVGLSYFYNRHQLYSGKSVFTPEIERRRQQRAQAPWRFPAQMLPPLSSMHMRALLLAQ